MSRPINNHQHYGFSFGRPNNGNTEFSLFRFPNTAALATPRGEDVLLFQPSRSRRSPAAAATKSEDEVLFEGHDNAVDLMTRSMQMWVQNCASRERFENLMDLQLSSTSIEDVETEMTAMMMRSGMLSDGHIGGGGAWKNSRISEMSQQTKQFQSWISSNHHDFCMDTLRRSMREDAVESFVMSVVLQEAPALVQISTEDEWKDIQRIVQAFSKRVHLLARRHVEFLQELIWKDGSLQRPLGKEQDPCSICFEPMSTKSAIPHRSGCGHVFHRVCITHWHCVQRRKGVSPSCPVCRTT